MMRGQKFKWGNESIFLIVSVFYGLGTSFLSEGYVQAYLIELGMGVREIGLYGTLGYIAALASYALFSLYKPKGGDYLPMMFMAALSLMLFPLILAAAGLFPALSMIVLFGSALYQFMAGFRGSCDYSVVPRIMPRSRYGGLSGKCGLIGSALAAVMSAVDAGRRVRKVPSVRGDERNLSRNFATIIIMMNEGSTRERVAVIPPSKPRKTSVTTESLRPLPVR